MGQKTNPSPTFPAFPAGAEAVTPSDSTTFAPSAIYVGVSGNVAVVTANGDAATFVGVVGGGLLPVQVIKVMSTGTTAVSIIRVY